MTLPNFVVIGAGKAGTTALYQWLRRHPDVYMPSLLKETFFFCYDPANPVHPDGAGVEFPITSLAAYEELFERAGNAKAIGEATPRYLDAPGVAERMHALIPDAKLIASLRDPVSRIYSHAQMNLRLGYARDLVDEARRLATTDEHVYAPKFRDWFNYYERDQFFLFRYDDLAADPQAILRQTFEFLDVDPAVDIDTSVVHNPGGVPKSALAQRLIDLKVLRKARPVTPSWVYDVVARLRSWNSRGAQPLPNDVRRELLDHYRQDIVDTEQLTGLDLSAWLTS